MISPDIFDIIARGGGGGSSSGGGGAGGIIVLPLIIIAVIAGWWARRKKIKKAKEALATAVSSDPTWDKDTITRRASDIFVQFQQDWSNFNAPGMQKYLTKRYYHHIMLMLAALHQMNRQNRMSELSLNEVTLMNVSDQADSELDSFDMEISASAVDQLVDATTQQVLFEDRAGFTELWHFDREDGDWKLDGIAQVDEGSSLSSGFLGKEIGTSKVREDIAMMQFAHQNNFFYNADFGWLLLPLRGALFNKASFGRSDINFHVIGTHHNVLVQFYNYVPVIENKRTLGDYFLALYKPGHSVTPYTVAQTTLPKTYGNIVVQAKKGSYSRYKPSGMQKISLEWPDFNKRYNVYATNVELATSLELLHPAYMERLFDVPFPVSIEIVDNVLYLYSLDGEADFNVMLELLKLAFDEMKM